MTTTTIAVIILTVVGFSAAAFTLGGLTSEWRQGDEVQAEASPFDVALEVRMTECQEAITAFFRQVNEGLESTYDRNGHEYWGYEVFAKHEPAGKTWATRAAFDAWIAPFCP